MMVEGLAMNVVTALGYSKTLGAVDVTESLVALVTQTRAVQGGNLAGLEATLAAQVVTLSAMFTQLAYQTSKMTIVDQNRSVHPPGSEGARAMSRHGRNAGSNEGPDDGVRASWRTAGRRNGENVRASDQAMAAVGTRHRPSHA
jgi:hypothetical protein